MKNLILPSLFFLLFTLAFTPSSEAIVAPKSAVVVPATILDLSENDIQELDTKAVEKKMGRSLKWKEKMALKWAKKKIKSDRAPQKNKHRENRVHDAGTDGMAIAGFVLGVIGLLYLGFLFGLLGVIFSAISLRRIRRNPDLGGRNLAIAGLVTGIIALFLWSAILAIAIAI